MNEEEKNQNTMEAEDRSLDEKIYRAMVELGWVFPQTIEEVEIAEEQMDQETTPPQTRLPTAKDILKRMAAANSSALGAEQTQEKQPLLPMLRQRARMKASAIAESLEVTVTFLSDISSYSGVIPLRPRKEIARLAKIRLPGITEQDVLDSFTHKGQTWEFAHQTVDTEKVATAWENCIEQLGQEGADSFQTFEQRTMAIAQQRTLGMKRTRN
jgi:hypothetical protein